jgi:phosphotransferase family enzyme
VFKHSHFDLMLHSTDELEAVLGERIAERRDVHGWPLSLVQRLTTASGARWIYKSQHAPTLEPDFYRLARSPVLTGSRVLSRDDVYAAMLFEFVDAPLLRDLQPSDADLVRHGRALMDEIGKIDRDAPAYIDIGAWPLWRDFVGSTLDVLEGLVATERLSLSLARPFDRGEIERWAGSGAVRRLIEQTSRLTHGDLKPDNVFVTPGGYKIIDWQRPQLAPAEVDLVSMLEGSSALFDHAPAPAVGVFYMLRLFWAVEAKANLLPGVDRLFDRWASEAIGFIGRADALGGK